MSIFHPSYSKFQLDFVIRTLNIPTAKVPLWVDDSFCGWQLQDISAAQKELRRLIDAWMESGPNLLKLFKTHPELQGNCTRGQTFLIPTRDGTAQLAWLPQREKRLASPHEEAAMTIFSNFLVNPLAHTLGGPCPRCGDYFIKRTKQHKVFCKRQCGTAQTALSATKRRREAESFAKLSKAERAIKSWLKLRGRRPEWKTWVAAEAGVYIQWLTLMVNKGKLAPPV